MDIGVVGLGRMGGNIARRLMRNGHRVVVFDRAAASIDALAGDGAVPARTPAELVAALSAPRAVWVMVPAGAATEGAIREFAEVLEPGDTIIDGGNTYYKDDIRRAAELRERGIHYVDVGTSGGVWGLERGYCLMIGGEREPVERLDPIFAALAPGRGNVPPAPGRDDDDDRRAEQGYIHAGPNGAGHFVKMVHNGIEYGLMQAYAEGFDLLRHAGPAGPPGTPFNFDLADIAEVWRRGSVISSWLLDLTASALAKDEALDGFEGHVEDSGEGRWTVEAAVAHAVPATVLTAALYARFRSRRDHTFADKLLSAMRSEFGGHVEAKRSE